MDCSLESGEVPISRLIKDEVSLTYDESTGERVSRC